jgi:hypothetical protein
MNDMRHETDTSEQRAERLARFLGPLRDRDREVVAHWRTASPAAHAAAMIELSRYAERTARQTGIGKDPAERFPGFRPLRLTRP